MVIALGGRRAVGSLFVPFLMFGCSSGAETPDGTGGGPDASAPVSTLEANVGPITAQPGMENTQCIVMRLKNAEGAFVRRFSAKLDGGSHHMIVYTTDETEEDLVPKDCVSFAGLLQGQHPLFIAQQARSELAFPSDEDGVPVGFEIAPKQMVRVEFHYINTTDKPLDVSGSISLDTVPLSVKVTRSDLMFWGTKDINIPPRSTFATGVKYQPALAGTKTFALTTHQHHLGTRMQVWYGTGDVGASEVVADAKSWSDPPLEIFDPPLDFPVGDGERSARRASPTSANTRTPRRAR